MTFFFRQRWRRIQDAWRVAQLRGKLDKIERLYRPDITASKTESTRYQAIQNMRSEMCEYEEELWHLESLDLERRGETVHISLQEIAPGISALEYWEDGAFGKNYIKRELFRKYAKAIEDREYERKKRKREGLDYLVKVWTAIAATIGAVGTVWLGLIGKK